MDVADNVTSEDKRIINGVKACGVCKTVRVAREFYLRTNSLTKRRSICKLCQLNYSTKYKSTHPRSEKCKETSRLYYQNNKEQFLRNARLYRIRHRDRINARKRDREHQMKASPAVLTKEVTQ